MAMNWVDIMILIVVVVSTLSSLRSGFLRQAFGLIGFVIGVYAALTHHKTLATMLTGVLKSPTVATVVAFVLLMIAVWIAFAVLGAMAYDMLKTIGLEWLDHLLGLVVGLLVGLFVIVCLLLLLIRIPVSGISDAVQRSALASLIFQILPHLKQLLPDDLSLFKVVHRPGS